LYGAVDKENNTIDFLLTKRRDKKSAKKSLVKAIDNNGLHEIFKIDRSDANLSTIQAYNQEYSTNIEIRQVKYLNNMVEQDQLAIKRIVIGMLGFKPFDSASITLKGIEMARMISKGQIRTEDNSVLSTTNIFYSLAA
jgi:putative transposase